MLYTAQTKQRTPSRLRFARPMGQSCFAACYRVCDMYNVRVFPCLLVRGAAFRNHSLSSSWVNVVPQVSRTWCKPFLAFSVRAVPLVILAVLAAGRCLCCCCRCCPVVRKLFVRPRCPFCKKAKRLVEDLLDDPADYEVGTGQDACMAYPFLSCRCWPFIPCCTDCTLLSDRRHTSDKKHTLPFNSRVQQERTAPAAGKNTRSAAPRLETHNQTCYLVSLVCFLAPSPSV